jgi:hypothetical protein
MENALLECIDPDTGEIMDLARLEQLELDLQDKVKNIGLYIINMRAEIKAYKEQEDNFKAKRQRLEKKVESLSKYLENNIGGKQFKFTEFEINHRKSTSVEITNVVDFELFAMEHPEYAKASKIEPDKACIKLAIANGIEIPGAELVTKNNMQIK